MAIINWSESIILVDLPLEPGMFDELDDVAKTIRQKHDCNVVLDFSGIEIMTGPGIDRVSILYKLLTEHKSKLVLCNVFREIKRVFISNKLDRLEFSDDKSTTLISLKMTG